MFQLPERREFLDNLRHLAHFSTKALLVTSESEGSFGHLLSALSAAEGDDLFVVDVNLAGAASVSQVLQRCLKRLQGEAAGSQAQSDEQVLAKMQQYAQRMAGAGQRVLLVFRSAEAFGADSTLTLASVLQNGRSGESHWGILFSAPQDLARQLGDDPRARNLVLPIHLKPLSRDEFMDYASLQLGAGVPSRQKLDRFHKKLGGHPEKVDAFILEQRAHAAAVPPKPTGAAKPAAAAVTPKTASPKTESGMPASKSGQTAFGAALAGASAVASPGSAPSRTEPLAAEPRKVATSDEAAAPRGSRLLRNRMLVLPIVGATLGTAILVTLFLYEGDEEVAELEPSQETVELEVPDLTPAPPALDLEVGPSAQERASEPDDGSEREVADSPESAVPPVVPPEGQVSSADLVDRIQEQFVRQRASGGFTPDDLMVDEPVETEAIAEPSEAETQPELAAEAADMAPTNREQLASRLLEGADVSDDAASENQAAAPARQSPEPTPSLPQKAETGEIERAEVESAPTESAPEATPATSSDRFRSAEWLAQQPSENWTIQMLGSYSEALVVRFLNSRPGVEKAVYIQSTYKNKPWFIVLNGSYATKAEAQRIVQALPDSLKKEDFWIRQIGGLK